MQYDLKNIKYTATETSSGQAWNPERDIYLNNEVCSVHAYYPYDEAISDITAIPVSTEGQVDYMYCSNPVNVSITNSKETLQMAHALSVITLIVQRGTYTGTGVVTQVGFVGAGIAKSATLNGKTGELSEFVGASEQLVNATDLTMQEVGQAVHTLIVPNGVESNVKISVWVDGVEYVVTAPSCAFEQGYRYEYTLTVDKGELGLSNVQMGDWGYNHLGNPVLWAGNYSITITGDVDSMAFFNEYKEDGSVRISAYGLREGLLVQPVVCREMEIDQEFDESKRMVDIGPLSENIVLEFNGFGTHDEYQERFYPAGTYTWTVPEGCYATDVFLVGGGAGSSTGHGGGGGYTATYRGRGYLQPEEGTWEGTATEGRDGNEIALVPGTSIEIIVGAGGIGTDGGYSQFMNEAYRANGGTELNGGSGAGGSGMGLSGNPTGGSDGGNGGKGDDNIYGTGQGHTTRDFGEPTGKRNAGGGGGAGRKDDWTVYVTETYYDGNKTWQETKEESKWTNWYGPYAGGLSDYSEGFGTDGQNLYWGYTNHYGWEGYTGKEARQHMTALGGKCGSGYGGGGGGTGTGTSTGGDGTVLLRYWIWHKK